MKSINDLYNEAKQDENIRKEFLVAYEKGEIEGFLKDNECDATIEDVQQFFEQELGSGSGKLSDEELSLVVGGKGDKVESKTQPKYQIGDHVQFDYTRLETGRILAPNEGWIITEAYLRKNRLSYSYDIRDEGGHIYQGVPEAKIMGRI